MFLSNQQAAAIAFLLIICAAAAGCSWFGPSDSVSVSPTAIAPPDTGIPFETKEPDTYQADFVTIAHGAESRSHFARKGGNWRIDTFADEKAARSIIRGDKLTYLDHIKRQFCEPPGTEHDPQTEFMSDLTTSLLSEKQPAKFQKIGTDGTLERYSAAIEGTRGLSTIVFDSAIKMVIRHEFDGGFAFEMRNFTLEVDDATFSVPNGYRKVSWATFAQR